VCRRAQKNFESNGSDFTSDAKKSTNVDPMK